MSSLVDVIKKLWRGNRDSEAKSFRENQVCEGAFDHIDRGICSVPLEQIVGSVGRYHDFDSQFKLKEHVQPDRLISVKQAMREGKSLPPVKLYKIKDEYYVLDGNHRIAAAKEFYARVFHWIVDDYSESFAVFQSGSIKGGLDSQLQPRWCRIGRASTL